MGRLSGRVIIVTGGASGLGEGIVRRAAEEGAKLVIADLNGEKAKALAASLGDAEAMGIAVDVAERVQVRAMVAAVTERFGGIDVLFNNAGFNKPLPFMDVDEANFNGIMRVNALGVMIGMQEVGRHMKERGRGGKIINTASIAGRQGYAEFAPYCASKAAVISLTQAAAREFAAHKITVNGIAPGVVVTPLWEGLERDMIEKGTIKEMGEFINSFSAGILVGRPATPADLAGICTFLASADSDYMTGQIIMCDGGMVLV
jgi:meso-butanediol dehydrogenase/(S,S)-butanediol dehydrogenase/diacetyl reductase